MTASQDGWKVAHIILFLSVKHKLPFPLPASNISTVDPHMLQGPGVSLVTQSALARLCRGIILLMFSQSGYIRKNYIIVEVYMYSKKTSKKKLTLFHISQNFQTLQKWKGKCQFFLIFLWNPKYFHQVKIQISVERINFPKNSHQMHKIIFPSCHFNSVQSLH